MRIGEHVGNPTFKRRQADGCQTDVSCPPCLPDYQKHMRGVDRGDQLESYYCIFLLCGSVYVVLRRWSGLLNISSEGGKRETYSHLGLSLLRDSLATFHPGSGQGGASSFN